MPPTDTSPTAVVRYLTHLLAAIVTEHNGEFRIPLGRLRSLADEPSRQMLVEDTDIVKDELVLRFGTKHSAVYPVEPECPTTPQSKLSAPSSSPSPAAVAPSVRPPQSVDELIRLEKSIRARRVQAQLRREQEKKQSDSSGISELNSTA